MLRNTHISTMMLCLFFLSKVSAQSSKVEKVIDNSSIRFELYHVNLKLISKDSIIPSEYVISVSVSDSIISQLKKLKKKEWIKFLSNSKTDWAANLILYDLFQNDATNFLSINSRAEWIKGQRKIDVEYWKRKLK